ncbi:MAG TPA: hypothetical protein VNQ74_13990, partial [Burkholderiaceae bacterium]|nr:hypothetical protein [Burkholderiaceae bacterium]
MSLGERHYRRQHNQNRTRKRCYAFSHVASEICLPDLISCVRWQINNTLDFIAISPTFAVAKCIE